MHGAIDLGGTKIEAALLDDDFTPIKRHRIATPNQDYDELLDAIELQVNWLKSEANDDALSIGICVPGIVNQETGLTLTSNLPTKGKRFRDDISERVGQHVPIENDCRAFALSEANKGAGEGYRKVFGLIVGTGIGGGICVDGKLTRGLNDLAVEIAHLPLPATLFDQYKLPILQCGCGRKGCYETFVAGPGIERLAEHMTGEKVDGETLSVRVREGDVEAIKVYRAWIEIYAQMLDVINVTIDPDVIILGGGTSNIPDLADHLALALEQQKLTNTIIPDIKIAKFGDSSGVRGAALQNQID